MSDSSSKDSVVEYEIDDDIDMVEQILEWIGFTDAQ